MAAELEWPNWPEFSARGMAALGLSYDQLRHALKRHKLLDAESAG
jgi:hypothetical protein